MRSVTIFTGIFERPDDLPRSERATRRLLNFLVLTNIDHIRQFPGTPKLYTSGVRYNRSIIWKDIYACIRARGADCKSLSAWRVAELVASGEDPHAKCVLKGGPLPRGGSRYHVTVKRSNAPDEDPSRRLGMK